MIRENIIFDPWPLFHTAERYFDREHLPVSDRIRIMGQLAHAIFTLPRSSSDPARPWPMDITLILARYVHLMRPQDPDIPERFWLFYVFAVQLEYRHQYMDSPLFVEPAYVALAAFRRQMERVSVMDVGARLTMRLYNQWYARALGSTCGELEQEERPHGCDVPFEGEDMSFWLNPSDITGQSIRDDVNDDRDTAVTLSTIQLADYVKFVQQLQRLPGIDLQKESLRLAKHALHFGLVDSIIEFREHVFGWRAISGQ